ncbi:formimidoylglutamate deiminase [Pilimelia anulata]|uniref:formimidoylglutamate deiminase n=1 Tax=Pilimelia anulata TaxID=53371 RepID=UPI0035711E0C
MAAHALLPGGPARDVLVEVAGDRIAAVRPGAAAPPDAIRLPGVLLPGLANAHSHAFHRALRGRTGHVGGDFWTWRDAMYAVAQRLDPDRYLELATAVYAEMALAGITCVGEFHYLHDDPDGRPYAEPGAMGDALIEAAGRVGIRITLLDTLYLTATVAGDPLDGVQRRFHGGGLDGWRERRAAAVPPHARRGAAIHSVRAVPASLLPEVRAAVRGPLHVHLSEQPAENAACLAAYGMTPAALLAAHGLLDLDTTAVHATHLTPGDVGLLGAARAGVCLCPTTERELADGIGPGRELAAAGALLSLGSDSHTEIDLFAEARGVEQHERLRTLARGHFAPRELLAAATVTGHAACGWPDVGRIAVGQRADLVAVALDTPRTAGVDPAGILAAATAADVVATVCGGRLLDRGTLLAYVRRGWRP